MKFSFFRATLPGFALAALVLTGHPTAAAPYTSMVVFGDSLSDSGNNFTIIGNSGGPVTGNTYIPSSPYASGVYSNGPVWASGVASALGVTNSPSQSGGTNYAYGGATTGTPGQGQGGFPFSLVAQANQYLASTGNVASPNALYVIEGGGNNVRAALAAIGGGADIPVTIATTAAAYAADIGAIVNNLQAAGATHIVVWDTPNVGVAPATLASGGPGAVALATSLAASMNAALAAQLFGEVGVSTFDIFGLGTAISLNPGTYGFTNGTDACGAAPIGTDCSKYVYWDGIHPTAAAHQLIAEAFLTIAAPVPEPSTWALMILGFAGVGFMAYRRRQVAALS
ncbi:MAG: SGNH/GDSL hydrolase family protein [Pseudomonadota bacterium]